MNDADAGWPGLDALAAQQHGYVHVRQAVALGVSRATFWRVSRRRRWHCPYPGVVKLPGAARSREGTIIAALLAVGDPVLPWGWTAAWLWDLVPALPTTIHVVVPASRRAPALERVRATRSRKMETVAREIVKGIPAPAPAPTICSVAGLSSIPLLRAIVVDARQRRLASLEEIAVWCDALSPAKGLAGLRRVLWELDVERCDSVLEWLLRRKLRQAGFRPDPGVAEVDAGSRTLHIDIPWLRQRVGIEVDGFGSHSTRASLNTDIRRHNRMQHT